jgi:hypothetical protein
MIATLALGHFLAVLILLQTGVAWGQFHGAPALLFHALLFPGWLIYLGLPADSIISFALAYPLNSALWGYLLALTCLRLKTT